MNDAAKLFDADVALKPWKSQPFNIYLEVDGQPGAIELTYDAWNDLATGKTRPVEWRLKQEFGREFRIEDPEVLAREWNATVEKFKGGIR